MDSSHLEEEDVEEEMGTDSEFGEASPEVSEVSSLGL